MIGLDTNVIIRYLVQDDPKQSKVASRFIENTVATGEMLWISHITLCEVIWVLERSYKLSKVEILDIIQKILETTQLQIENEDVVRKAFNAFKNTISVGFSDCLIGKQNFYHGCSRTVTFDKDAAKHLHDNFMLIQ